MFERCVFAQCRASLASLVSNFTLVCNATCNCPAQGSLPYLGFHPHKVSQMTTLLTSGKVQYKGDGSTIITKQDLCSSPTLVARFHLATLKYMINMGIFDETCMESAKAMLTQLQQQKEATERRNKDRKLKLQQAKKQCTMDAYLNQKPSISSTTTSELITVRESKPLSSSSASSDSDFPLE